MMRSVVGVFVRHVVFAFEAMSFDALARLWY